MADDRVYTLDQLDELEQMNEENVTQAHLNIAMEYVVRVLEESDIPYAVMGGMHMIMRGYEDRSTTDVDIAVQCNPRTILGALESDRR
jgi:predicted nucleotidyltransferase